MADVPFPTSIAPAGIVASPVPPLDTPRSPVISPAAPFDDSVTCPKLTVLLPAAMETFMKGPVAAREPSGKSRLQLAAGFASKSIVAVVAEPAGFKTRLRVNV